MTSNAKSPELRDAFSLWRDECPCTCNECLALAEAFGQAFKAATPERVPNEAPTKSSERELREMRDLIATWPHEYVACEEVPFPKDCRRCNAERVLTEAPAAPTQKLWDADAVRELASTPAEPLSAERERELIEHAIKMAWKVGSEGGSVDSISYEDVISGADYD
jgi:hypothetical protein